jgi:hypothetical protein
MTKPIFNFVGKVEKDSTIIYDMRVMLNGEARFFIIKVHPHAHALFLRKVEEDKGMTLEDYGTILHRGFGEPDMELKAMLRERYALPYPMPESGVPVGQESQ